MAMSTRSQRTQVSITPKLDQLLKALKTLKGEWFTFGAKLGVPGGELKAIESSHNQDLELCLTKALQYWLNNTLEAGWNEVIAVLEGSGQTVLAREIKKEYSCSEQEYATSEQEGAVSPDQESVTTITPLHGISSFPIKEDGKHESARFAASQECHMPVFPHVPEKPNITPDELMDLILNEKTVVPAGSVLLTVSGLPSCEKSSLVAKMLEKEFKMTHDELMRVAEIKEEGKEFSFFELGGVKDKDSEKWQWYRFTKMSGYISCFVSALESGENQARGKFFEYQPHKQYLFDDEVLDHCFYNVYQLLSAYYNEYAMSADSIGSISIEKLAGATLSLVNVWDIGFNRAVLHFLTLLGGYLHHNFPVITLTYPDDVEHLTELLDISNNELLKGLEPVLHQYTRAKFLLTFSHLGRSFNPNTQRKGVCQVVAILDPKRKPERGQHQEIIEDLKQKILTEAKKCGAEYLISESPWIVDPESKEDLITLKKSLNKFTSSEKQDDIPLSWLFLRSAFFKTGQLYIKRSELEKHAEKCKITGDKFEKFLSRFTSIGSIIHIPDIPVFCDYVILNPPDFFHKLTELFYPRYNGELQYGVASFSTLRRLFGEHLQFFCDVLTSCSFAVKIESKKVVYYHDHKLSRLPIHESCLYIPGMRTEVASKEDKQIRKDSLLLVYTDKALLPTHTTENVVKYLFKQSKIRAKLYLVTCDCYTVTRFAYYPNLTQQPKQVSSPQEQPRCDLSMISHGDKNELRITNDEEGATDIKKEVVRAYRYADKVYNDYQQKVLGIKSEFEFALVCQENPNVLHPITGDTACPECCETEEAYKRMWIMWRQVLHETRET